LAYAQPAGNNLSLRITEVRRNTTFDAAELLLSFELLSSAQGEGRKSNVPVEIEIDGARSSLPVEIDTPRVELKDFRLPLDRNQQRGWGRVSIPADQNVADNRFYFVFDEPPPRRTLIVADDLQAVRPLQLAAEVAPNGMVQPVSEVLSADQLAAVAWEEVALLLWQAPLPRDEIAPLVTAFVERGGQVIFFPPRVPGEDALFGVRWTKWVHTADGTSADGTSVRSWRGDQDLVAHTQSGAALPVGDLRIAKYCELEGDVTPLVTLSAGTSLLARAATPGGGAYYFGTTPSPADSSLAGDGVVLYVAVQRALAAGAAVLGKTRRVIAGSLHGDTSQWKRLAGADEALSTQYMHHQGVYSHGERLLAVCRSASEDDQQSVSDFRLEELFAGLDFVRVDDQSGNAQGLVQEIWRMFLTAMMLAMVVEAGLCLPKLRNVRQPFQADRSRFRSDSRFQSDGSQPDVGLESLTYTTGGKS
jgi:hypothetical protein